MKLFTSLPARRDGTLNVVLGDGTKIVFTGTPLSADVEDEDHADELEGMGFLSQEDFEAEAEFQRKAQARALRQAAREGRRTASPGTFAPGEGADDDDEDDTPTDTNAAPLEANTPPTGVVRRAGRASVVKKA